LAKTGSFIVAIITEKIWYPQCCTPGVAPAEYEEAIRTELVADGTKQEAATAEVKWLDDCFASYVVPNHQQRSQTK
jgi:hypothetical protein